jgi:uncharacterized membrane protein
MKPLVGHLTRCLIAGFVALLPVGGLIFSVAYAEYLISEVWLLDQDFYFPGLGLLAVAAALYIVGLVVSTFLGRWIWSRVDRLLEKLPTLGQLYQTLKQVIGYGEGEDAIFRQVVLLNGQAPGTQEFGLVTNEVVDGGTKKLTVFVPGAPNPAAGRLVLVAAQDVQPVNLPVSDALKALVSLGKTNMAVGNEGEKSD